MLTELCQELKNWFDRGQTRLFGTFTISDDVITRGGEEVNLQIGQYFRICGSTFNDGVHQYGTPDLTEETWNGAIWPMAVPPDVLRLADEIDEWNAKYGGIDSAAMSPYTSESFGGYSYSKPSGGSASGQASSGTWQSAFANRLNLWRKIR